MEKTEPKVETPPITNEKPSIGRDCQKCLTHLTRALDRVGSRPQSLLRALGVISHGGAGGSDDNNNGSKIYEPTQDGRGLLITLAHKSKEVGAIVGPASLDEGSSSHLQQGRKQGVNTEVSIDRGKKIPSSVASNGTKEGHVPLGRRLTNAATLLADGIRHSAEDILNDNGGVLTTSPAMVGSPSQPDQVVVQPEQKIGTTIAIECMTCGSDTRAEAGARAFVKGPEPLSIVLCSNRLSSQREVDEVLVHELVHIYDVHSRKMDLRDCRQLAYSEVRAAREAECSNSLTAFTANICAKDKATVATRNMFPDEGRKCVCDVFNEAMSDLAPFESSSSVASRPEISAFLKAGCVKDVTPPNPPFSRQSDR
ncbi:hypothetical protein ACHAXR_005592 [Thalassiosira sp. AJA248-18]